MDFEYKQILRENNHTDPYHGRSMTYNFIKNYEQTLTKENSILVSDFDKELCKNNYNEFMYKKNDYYYNPQIDININSPFLFNDIETLLENHAIKKTVNFDKVLNSNNKVYHIPSVDTSYDFYVKQKPQTKFDFFGKKYSYDRLYKFHNNNLIDIGPKKIPFPNLQSNIKQLDINIKNKTGYYKLNHDDINMRFFDKIYKIKDDYEIYDILTVKNEEDDNKNTIYKNMDCTPCHIIITPFLVNIGTLMSPNPV